MAGHMSIIRGNPDGYHRFCGDADCDAIGEWGERFFLDGEATYREDDDQDLAALEFEGGMNGGNTSPLRRANCSRGNEGCNDPLFHISDCHDEILVMTV